MKSYRVIGFSLAALVLAGVSIAANPDGTFTGSGTLTNFQAPGQPTKEKQIITLQFNAANTNSTLRINDDPTSYNGPLLPRVDICTSNTRPVQLCWLAGYK